MSLAPSSELKMGRLTLFECEKKACNVVGDYASTSGLPGYQTLKGRSIRAKGPIPDGQKLKVSTKPVHLNQRGIEGNFYPILPTRIKGRSQFGIHADRRIPGSPSRSAPGTAGCIGVKDDENWVELQLALEELAAKGIERVELIINYQSINTDRI